MGNKIDEFEWLNPVLKRPSKKTKKVKVKIKERKRTKTACEFWKDYLKDIEYGWTDESN